MYISNFSIIRTRSLLFAKKLLGNTNSRLNILNYKFICACISNILSTNTNGEVEKPLIIVVFGRPRVQHRQLMQFYQTTAVAT